MYRIKIPKATATRLRYCVLVLPEGIPFGTFFLMERERNRQHQLRDTKGSDAAKPVGWRDSCARPRFGRAARGGVQEICSVVPAGYAALAAPRERCGVTRTD